MSQGTYYMVSDFTLHCLDSRWYGFAMPQVESVLTWMRRWDYVGVAILMILVLPHLSYLSLLSISLIYLLSISLIYLSYLSLLSISLIYLSYLSISNAAVQQYCRSILWVCRLSSS